MPPAAARMTPWKWSVAPVNDPLRWPNNCESSMSLWMLLQLKGRNVAVLRGWSRGGGVRASTSLPVPVSPVIRTGTGDGGNPAHRGEQLLHLFG